MPYSLSDVSTYGNYSSGNAQYVTNNGTPIVSSSSEADTNMFLKLLVAQMTNQDPFASDQDPTKYVTQLAQFSQLEQMQQFNSNLSILSAVNNGILINSALSTATTMIGKEAEFYTVDSDSDSDSIETVKGIVESVYVEDGSVFVELKVDGSDTLIPVRYDTFIKVTGNNKE